MWARIKRCICIYNPFTIGSLINDIKNDTNNILYRIDSEADSISKLQEEIEALRDVKEKYKNMLEAIGNTIPDMMWFKTVDGKYQYVNKSIRDGLFYGMETSQIIGRDDIEITSDCKKIAGDENHTFGIICGNSDVEVLNNLVKERFLEWGLIGGKDLYLEVYKAPIYNKKGELIGTVGTGRDVTEYYLSLKKTVNDTNEILSNISKCGNNKCFGRLDTLVEQFSEQLDRYKFEV